MDDKLIDDLYFLVEEACKSEKNIFGYGIWTHHIKPMIEIGKQLAKEYNADPEIVIIACLLHDLSQIKDKEKKEKHHIHSSIEAEQILKEYKYPQDKIDIIKKCVFNHRSSVNNKKNSPEEISVADADAIAHINEIGSLFYAAYKELNMNIDDGVKWIKEKIEKDWLKMSNRSKEYYKEKYESIMVTLK